MAIRKSLLQKIFSGTSILRWNDKLRPVELQETDKQGHKMLTALTLWLEHAQAGGLTEGERVALGWKIVEGGLFDYFYRLVITDIKPPVIYKILENPEDERRLTSYVINELEPFLAPLGEFWNRLKQWHSPEAERDEAAARAREILDAAHMFASFWEFRLIRPMNGFDDEMDFIEQDFRRRLDHSALPGMRDILKALSGPGGGRPALAGFANLCGQLRFHIRWTQTPRIPVTSVLGHMFLVATYAWLFSLAIGACRARAVNNFFCGLCHDLPEALTRDIISPVKKSVAGLSDLIRRYEEEKLQERVLGPLRGEGHGLLADRLAYYLGTDRENGSEFDEAIRGDGGTEKVESFDDLHDRHNADGLDPKDGALIKTCDLLAAFLEAHASISAGVAAPQLVAARSRLREGILEIAPRPLKMRALLADFD